MSNVTNIAEHRPHTAGDAYCTSCGHRWMAVIPTGIALVDCPECGCGRAMRAQMVVPADGVATFRCLICENTDGATNDVFTITQDYAQCCGCGERHYWQDVFE